MAAPALIRSFPSGFLVLLRSQKPDADGIDAAEIYEDAVSWAKDCFEGIFRNEYYEIQRLNNQLIDSKRALARSNSRLQQAMEEVQQTNRELEAAHETVQQALRLAEQANRSKTAFLASVSHDIRTPMNAIVGFISLLERDNALSENQKAYLGKMRASSQHLLGLINDVLDISKIETDGMNLEQKPLSISAQVEQVETMILAQAKAKQQDFSVKMGQLSHDRVLCDAVRLRQVLMNLLSNAVKYTANGGTICLEIAEMPCRKPGCMGVRFSVSDNGCGMSPEFAAHVFDPFVRDERVAEIQGTGLGMAITKNIVDKMGGTIRVSSAINAGSCFTVQLELPIDTDMAEQSRAGSPETAEASLKGKHFLCAEDNDLNAEILQALLQMEGASSDFCANGLEAVEAFAAAEPGRYDAILMDVQMPVMNGLDATRAIRRSESPIARTIPIIAMTANAFSEDVQRCLASGMDAHIAKPIDIAALERTLQSVLDGKHSGDTCTSEEK